MKILKFQLLYAISTFRLYINENTVNAMYCVFDITTHKSWNLSQLGWYGHPVNTAFFRPISDRFNGVPLYFKDKLAEVKSVAAYWNLIAEGTNPVGRNRIFGSLAVSYKKKRGLANIAGTRLGRANREF